MCKKNKILNVFEDVIARSYNTVDVLFGGKTTPSLLEPIFFFHIEKCGGSSVAHAFKEHLKDIKYNDFSRFKSLDGKAALEASKAAKYPSLELRKILAYYFLSPDIGKSVKFVRGHFAIDRDILSTFNDKYLFITTVRNPIDKWVSSFFYNYRKGNNDHGSINESIEDFIGTERSKVLGYDYIRMTCSKNIGPEQLKDKRLVSKYADKSAEILDSFDMVVKLSEMNKLQKYVNKNTSWNINIGHKNKTSNRKSKYDIDSEIMDKIKKVCKPNILVYKKLFNEE